MDDLNQTKPFAEIAALLTSPYGQEKFSAISQMPYLLLDLAETSAKTNTHAYKHVCERIRQLPCPTIGISDPSMPSSELSIALDVVLSLRDEAKALIYNIRRCPLAAMILVQVLRHTENASIPGGLFIESLAYATLQGGYEYQTHLEQKKEEFDVTTEPSVKEDGDAEPAVIIERLDNQLLLTLNRPQRLNAYSIEIRDALTEGLQLLADDPSITKATIRGRGAYFCIGGDLREFGSFIDTPTAHAIRSMRNVGRLISEHAQRIECRVHGACIGSGIELPAFGSRVVATEDTLFQLPEITFGLIPGAGGTVSIPRRIGRQRTAYLALSAKKINAKTALSWGLIDAIE